MPTTHNYNIHVIFIGLLPNNATQLSGFIVIRTKEFMYLNCRL